MAAGPGLSRCPGGPALHRLTGWTRRDVEDYYLGYSNRKAGRLEIGITYYSKALAIDPSLPAAHEMRGLIYDAMGDFERADAELREQCAVVTGVRIGGGRRFRMCNAGVPPACTGQKAWGITG